MGSIPRYSQCLYPLRVTPQMKCCFDSMSLQAWMTYWKLWKPRCTPCLHLRMSFGTPDASWYTPQTKRRQLKQLNANIQDIPESHRQNAARCMLWNPGSCESDWSILKLPERVTDRKFAFGWPFLVYFGVVGRRWVRWVDDFMSEQRVVSLLSLRCESWMIPRACWACVWVSHPTGPRRYELFMWVASIPSISPWVLQNCITRDFSRYIVFYFSLFFSFPFHSSSIQFSFYPIQTLFCCSAILLNVL